MPDIPTVHPPFPLPPAELSATLFRFWEDERHLSASSASTIRWEIGPCSLSSELAEYLGTEGIARLRGKPCHPTTQDKMKRYVQSIRNEMLRCTTGPPGGILKRDNFDYAMMSRSFNSSSAVRNSWNGTMTMWGPTEVSGVSLPRLVTGTTARDTRKG